MFGGKKVLRVNFIGGIARYALDEHVLRVFVVCLTERFGARLKPLL